MCIAAKLAAAWRLDELCPGHLLQHTRPRAGPEALLGSQLSAAAGWGLGVCIAAMLAAAGLEKWRLDELHRGHTLPHAHAHSHRSEAER